MLKLASEEYAKNKKDSIDMRETACLLISAGHMNVLQYGYSMIKTAMGAYEKNLRHQSLAIAMGIAACLNKDTMSELTKEI